MAVVKLNYLTRGMKAVQTIGQAAKYYTFRNGPDLAARVWYANDGRVTLYNAVQAEIAAGAQAYAYSYRVVISAKDADLTAAGYHAVLAGQFERYYFIEHHNTAVPHAHVIGFRKELVSKAELHAMRAQARKLERARAQEQQVLRAQSPDRGGGAQGQIRPQLEHARDRGIDGPGGD